MVISCLLISLFFLLSVICAGKVEKMQETLSQGRSLNSLLATISSLSSFMAQHLKEKEEERIMLHFAVSDSDADAEAEAERSKLLLFPKPRRLGRPIIPEFLKPLKCNKHSQTGGITTQIMKEKMRMEEDLMEERECECISPCYPGPPPCRTDNPLVNDAQFIHQMQLLSPFSLS